MAEMIFRIPSRTVQYGYVELQLPAVTYDATPEMVAAQYVSYVYAFQKEEEATVERIKKGVTSSVAAPEGEVEAQAQELLDKGLGGVTEVSGGDAPWTKPAAEAKPKPWEKAAPAADSEW